MTVIELRKAPLVNDIPGQLRQMADAIEAGEHGDVTTGLFLLPVSGDWPEVFGWGDIDGENHPIIQFQFALAKFSHNQMRR